MNNTQQSTVAVVVRVKEMNEDGLAVLRRGEGRKCEVRVYFPKAKVHKWYPIRKVEMIYDTNGEPQRIVKRLKPAKEYVSMWSRFLNYFGLKRISRQFPNKLASINPNVDSKSRFSCIGRFFF